MTELAHHSSFEAGLEPDSLFYAQLGHEIFNFIQSSAERTTDTIERLTLPIRDSSSTIAMTAITTELVDSRIPQVNLYGFSFDIEFMATNNAVPVLTLQRSTGTKPIDNRFPVADEPNNVPIIWIDRSEGIDHQSTLDAFSDFPLIPGRSMGNFLRPIALAALAREPESAQKDADLVIKRLEYSFDQRPKDKEVIRTASILGSHDIYRLVHHTINNHVNQHIESPDYVPPLSIINDSTGQVIFEYGRPIVDEENLTVLRQLIGDLQTASRGQLSEESSNND